MTTVIGDITVSLDGFVTAEGAGPRHGLGVGGEALHVWAMEPDAVDQDVLDTTTAATGAVLMGRNTYDVVDGPDGWQDDLGYGGRRDQSAAPPVFVVTHEPPATTRLKDRFTFVATPEEGVERARAAAGDRDVLVMGGGQLVRECLRRGLLDRLTLHVAPVLLGAGTPLFDGDRGPGLVQGAVRPSGNAVHVTYDVVR
ncbi:dihydrofolate reductase family protein [Spirilliplanes yamanashiensis]|uniref:DNA-binding protein n=1 Tax=Spirilliplanes yamanashiensis TaxID=42233 RepID=A0A8J3YE37_9ACTN|nr:dihydrofolate reductase family protein [Spirilliplanes yamanashiensis]MDP9816585.1 dihydrofolate reductase [Spirilliplanes yamanashiensis]GIJ06112.1 DNA-binding protein [Spirilliplanes yamanashiensis]